MFYKSSFNGRHRNFYFYKRKKTEITFVKTWKKASAAKTHFLDILEHFFWRFFDDFDDFTWNLNKSGIFDMYFCKNFWN
jgi:hypothetical protein